MAEYIERDIAAAFANNCGAVYVANRLSDSNAFPAADVAPVVRCRECKYHNRPPCPMRLSFNWTEDNDFCSYGERKDGGSENG